jgi:hypothetical protein
MNGNDPDRDDCDPYLVDRLACQVKGIAEQAKYNETHQPALVTAKTTYDTTRKDYREKRSSVALQVQDLRHTIKHLVERIKCLIKQKRVIECVDEAYLVVVEQLEACGFPAGCCADDECDFDTDCADLDYDDLVKRIARYQKHTDRAKECFTNLLTEPADLVAKVNARKKDIDDLNALLAADSPTTDLRDVYARAKVVRYQIQHIWNGFDETRDYVDCLCRALTCWTKGSAAISILIGIKAVRDCERDAADTRCGALRDHTVDAILTEYDRICPRPYCEEDDEPAEADDGDGNADPDRGDHDAGDHSDDSDDSDDDSGWRDRQDDARRGRAPGRRRD